MTSMSALDLDCLHTWICASANHVTSLCTCALPSSSSHGAIKKFWHFHFNRNMSHRPRKRAATFLMEKMICSRDADIVCDDGADTLWSRPSKKTRSEIHSEEETPYYKVHENVLQQTHQVDVSNDQQNSMLELVAVCQAINLVPPSLKHYRLFYMTNIVKQSLSNCKLTTPNISSKVESIQQEYSSTELQSFGVPPRHML